MKKFLYVMAILLSLVFVLNSTGQICLAADVYPSRPIQYIIQFPAGGSSDPTVRLLAEKMEPILKQKVLVINKAGGGGTTGTAWVTTQKPDGYTILHCSPGPFAARTIVEKVPYSYKDFEYIAQIALFEELIVCRSESPWKSAEDLIAAARKNPGKYTYGSSGAGAVGHVLMENFKYAFNLDITHVPFKGSAAVLPAVLGGHVDLGASEVVFEPHVASGVLRKLFTSTSLQYKSDPKVKNFKDLGKDITVDAWTGVVAPKGTPKEILKKLEAAVKIVCADPVFNETSRKIGTFVAFDTGENFARRVEGSYNLAKATMDRLGLSAK